MKPFHCTLKEVTNTIVQQSSPEFQSNIVTSNTLQIFKYPLSFHAVVIQLQYYTLDAIMYGGTISTPSSSKYDL